MGDVSITKTSLSSLIAIMVFISGKFNDLFWILVLLMITDYATGYIAAWLTKTKSSRIGLVGIFKKIMYMVFVVFGFMIDMVIVRFIEQLHLHFSFQDLGGISVGVAIILFYIGNETISIAENFTKMNIIIPGWIYHLGSLLRDNPQKHIEKFINDTKDLFSKNKDDTETQIPDKTTEDNDDED